MERKHLVTRFDALKTERQSFVSHWKDIAEYMLPRTPRWLTSDVNKGDKKNQKIYDNKAGLALRHLASGLVAGITSPARPWFKLGTADPDLANYSVVKAWLYTVQMRMLDVFAKSNLYNALPTCYKDLGGFGTHAMMVKKDFDTTIRCYSFPMGSYVLANDNRLRVDTCYREYSMTVNQLVREFGLERCSERVRNWHTSNKGDIWVPVVTAIQPNADHRPGNGLSKHKPFSSITFERDGRENDLTLEDMGYDEFPILSPRWETTGEDVYGSSPGMEALPTVKQLQLAAKRKAQAIDKYVNPPMVGPSSLKTQRASLLPGDITYVDTVPGGQSFAPAYQIQPRIGELVQDIQDMRQEISTTFFEDLFLMLAQSDRRQITAREIDERHEEKLLMLGPVLERLHDELLDPLIERTFNIMLRENLLPPIPDELQGVAINVDYISIMAQAQKLVGTASVERFFGFLGNLAGVKPDVMDAIDFDEGVAAYGDMCGVPPKILRDKEQVAAIREANAQAAQNAQMMEGMKAAQAGAQSAKLLSETDMDPNSNSLLSRMLGIGEVQ